MEDNRALLLPPLPSILSFPFPFPLSFLRYLVSAPVPVPDSFPLLSAFSSCVRSRGSPLIPVPITVTVPGPILIPVRSFPFLGPVLYPSDGELLNEGIHTASHVDTERRNRENITGNEPRYFFFFLSTASMRCFLSWLTACKGQCMCVLCVCMCVFVKFHITTQSGPVILVILCHSH